MRALVVATVLLSVVLAAPAGAQEDPGPTQEMQGPQVATTENPAAEPQGKTPSAPGAAGDAASLLGLTPDLTVEQVMERLRRVLGLFSPFGPAGEAVVTSAAETRRGDVIVAVPVSPRRVGRLATDLVQQGTMFARERVVMPAGTPVYFTRFQYTVTSGYGVILQSREYDAWCGVVTEGRRQRQVSYCALESGGLRHVSTSIGGSPYWPRNMTAPVAANAFAITEDQSVVSEFPRLELTYTFVEFDETDADVRRGVRVNGGEVVELNNVSLVRQRDGSSVLRVAGGELRIERTGSRRVAHVAVATAPRAYNPDEEEAQLRLIAEAFVARMQAQRAAAAPAPPQPQ
jgi:hypothetical protein